MHVAPEVNLAIKDAEAYVREIVKIPVASEPVCSEFSLHPLGPKRHVEGVMEN
jgi:hypothetical protein